MQVLLLSTLTSCSRLDALPALASDGVSLLSHKLSHRSPNIRREAAAAMMALRSNTRLHFVECEHYDSFQSLKTALLPTLQLSSLCMHIMLPLIKPFSSFQHVHSDLTEL